MSSGLQDAVSSGFAAIRVLEAELLHATEDGRLADWRVLGARHGPRGEITVAADIWPTSSRFDPRTLARRIEHDHARLRCALYPRRLLDT